MSLGHRLPHQCLTILNIHAVKASVSWPFSRQCLAMVWSSQGPLPLQTKLLHIAGAKELVVGMRACAFIRVRVGEREKGRICMS